MIIGDQVSRRGALTGGYYDTRRSRLDCQRSIQEVQAEIETYRAGHGEIREQLERILFNVYFLQGTRVPSIRGFGLRS